MLPGRSKAESRRVSRGQLAEERRNKCSSKWAQRVQRPCGGTEHRDWVTPKDCVAGAVG